LRKPGRAAYDLVVIGSGPAGRQASLEAAGLGKRVALVERAPWVGGSSADPRFVAGQTLQAAARELAGPRRDPAALTPDDLFWRVRQVTEHERDSTRDRLRYAGVQVVEGSASFVDPWTVAAGAERLRGERILIAVGAEPGVQSGGRIVTDPGGLAQLDRVPATLTVVGATVAGVEVGSAAAALGVDVTVVDRRASILEFVDRDLVDALEYHLRGLGVTLRLGEEVAYAQLSSEVVLYTAGRVGATEGLNLAAAGFEGGARGFLTVDSSFRTTRRHIFAAGDVLGSFGLATRAREQGRLAALAAFGQTASRPPVPHALATVPELSFVGAGERELTATGVPYVAGVAWYRDLVRCALGGERAGLLKLLVDAETRRILGAHHFGAAAGELVHIGQAAIAGGLAVDDLLGTIFNVSSASEAYALAALDAARRLETLAA
jgi:NAD(P) transhydrogenase